MFALFKARAELDRAKKNVPAYTAQWSDEDYYRDEQQAYDAAVTEYEAAHAPTANEIKAHVLIGVDK